jgi:hypothetical protein
MGCPLMTQLVALVRSSEDGFEGAGTNRKNDTGVLKFSGDARVRAFACHANALERNFA